MLCECIYDVNVFGVQCKKPDQKIKPYLKPHLPKRFHYAHSRRIEDVNVLVDSLWLFERYNEPTSHPSSACTCENVYNVMFVFCSYPGSLSFCSGGNHGYDNDDPSMQVCVCVCVLMRRAHYQTFSCSQSTSLTTSLSFSHPPFQAMFLSYGPKFNFQTEVEPFSNIELYNLMCGEFVCLFVCFHSIKQSIKVHSLSLCTSLHIYYCISIDKYCILCYSYQHYSHLVNRSQEKLIKVHKQHLKHTHIYVYCKYTVSISTPILNYLIKYNS